MPYQPYDTGWIKSVYSAICLGWFLLSTGLLPRFTMYSIYSNMWNPFSTTLIKLCESTGAFCIYAGTKFVKYESILFQYVEYVAPIYDMIQYIQSMVPCLSNGRPPSFNFVPANNRQRKTSTGKHLGSYFARKRRHRRRNVISGSNQSKNDNCKQYTPPDPTCSHPMEANSDNFHPSDDPSCQDNTWYDAISPYWTGGMIWDGAFTSSTTKLCLLLLIQFLFLICLWH
jgi:hypothetical protein